MKIILLFALIALLATSQAFRTKHLKEWPRYSGSLPPSLGLYTVKFHVSLRSSLLVLFHSSRVYLPFEISHLFE